MIKQWEKVRRLMFEALKPINQDLRKMGFYNVTKLYKQQGGGETEKREAQN